MATIGSQSRQLIKLIQTLEKLGINAALPSLPKFVVVGDQSHGKSSVVESICDIKLPRGQGTVTRCPFQITTSASGPYDPAWTCQVILQPKYRYDPTSKAGHDRTKYDRWPEYELPVFHFATIHDKNQLDGVLKCAQLAVLNPSQDPTYYQSADPSSSAKTQVGFSPNVIHLKLKGPELPELSFVDLPGAINVHPDPREQYLVPFVERLLKNYIRDKKALVLLAMSSDQDVATSTAFRFVDQCQARERTMGVLTKPDLITASRMHDIENIIKGVFHRVGSGWYVTKQLSHEEIEECEREISYAEARAREQDFFSSGPWISSLATMAHRFGITNVQTNISRRLTEHIYQDLPEITQRVQSRLNDVLEEMKHFPERPQSASYAVTIEVQNLARAIITETRGDGRNKDFRAAYKGLFRRLQGQLKSGLPNINVRTPGYVLAAISVDSDDEDESTSTPTATAATVATATKRQLFETPSKKRKGGEGQAFPTPLKGGRSVSQTPRTQTSRNTEGARSDARGLSLDEIRAMYDLGSNSGLPDQINPEVTNELIRRSVLDWGTLADDLLNNLSDLLSQTLQSSIQTVLATRRLTQLFDNVSGIIEGLVRGLLNEETKRVKHIVDCETHKPIAYDMLFGSRTESEKSDLLRKRHVQRVHEHYDTLDSRGFKVPHGNDREKKFDDETLRAQLGPDEYNREIIALATPQAYYKIASARMVDTIANHLEFGLIYGLETNILPALNTGLKVMDEEHCQVLLAEDPAREQLRLRLNAEKDKLEIALRELTNLPQLELE